MSDQLLGCKEDEMVDFYRRTTAAIKASGRDKWVIVLDPDAPLPRQNAERAYWPPNEPRGDIRR